MGVKISFCGKGGCGKSTLVGLLARQATARGLSALVVDSDESNAGLHRLLGFETPPQPLMDLVGGKQALKEKMGTPGIFDYDRIDSDQIPADYRAQADGIRLVTIGKIHQALEGCACPMGVLSKEFLNKLKCRDDEIALIDMEAGIEHFGRGVDIGIDGIVLVIEPSFESLVLAGKIKTLASGLGKPTLAVLNKVPSASLERRLLDQLTDEGIASAGAIPSDEEVFGAGLEGRPFEQGAALKAAETVLDRLLNTFKP